MCRCKRVYRYVLLACDVTDGFVRGPGVAYVRYGRLVVVWFIVVLGLVNDDGSLLCFRVSTCSICI